MIVAVGVCRATTREFMVKNSEDGKSIIHVFLPDAGKATGRMVIACPGGGYGWLSVKNEGTDWADFFLRQGIAYSVLHYRLPNGDRTIPMGDAMQAIRTVRDSAKAWHVNPHDVGIMGFSAGGHLASAVATHAPTDARPDFQILFYPVISMMEGQGHHGSWKNFLGDERNNPQMQKLYSSDQQVRSHQTPPCILLMVGDDQTVPVLTNGLRYYEALRREGIAAALHVYPSGGHGFGFQKSFRYHEQMKCDLTSWLQTLSMPRADAIRVACIGNSITYGDGIDMRTERGYPARLQKMLGDGYYVRNFGVCARTVLMKGDKPYRKVSTWREALAFQPDIVIIKLGTNDSKPQNWQYGSDYERDLQQMIDTLKALDSTPKIYLCTPIPAFKEIKGISDSLIANGICPIVKDVARKNGCGIIDLHKLFAPYGQLVQDDGIHPKAEGAEKIAGFVYERIHDGSIRNGIQWQDDRGEPVSAHGANILYDKGKYWLFGEYKTDSANVFTGFSCYSSSDLANWKFERLVFKSQPDGRMGPRRVGERPKVLKCPTTGEYVMLMHSDNLQYKDPCVCFATSPTINGEYTFRGPLLYKGEPICKWDIGSFMDDDGCGYLLVHHGQIFRLSDDFHSADSLMVTGVKGTGESPAIFKKNGIYYWLSSRTTSWERNDNMYFTSRSLFGPWTPQGEFCPKGTLTWNSQCSFVLMLPDGTPMYMGDRWSFPRQYTAATYVWLPMQADGERLTIPKYYEIWNPTTGRQGQTEGRPIANAWRGQKPGDAMRLKVEGGCRIAIYGDTDSSSCYADVVVRGQNGERVVETSIDFYSKVPASGLRWLSPILPSGTYTLEIKVSAMKPNWTDKTRTQYGSTDYQVKISQVAAVTSIAEAPSL